MFTQLLAKSPAKRAGERLYQAASRQGRAEAFYTRMGAPDTVEGRFELLTLHVILLVDRLKNAPAPAEDVRQRLFDAYLSHLDGALREMGVGDLAVGKRMRRLGEAFYGRARAYDRVFDALPNAGPLEELLDRTALLGVVGSAGPLATYVVECRERLGRGDPMDLIAGEPNWSTP